MTFEEAIKKSIEMEGFSQVELHQDRRWLGARVENDGTMTLKAIVRQSGSSKQVMIEDAAKNNPKAFSTAMKFKERGLWK